MAQRFRAEDRDRAGSSLAHTSKPGSLIYQSPGDGPMSAEVAKAPICPSACHFYSSAEVVLIRSPRPTGVSTCLRWSFGHPGLPHSFLVSCGVLGTAIG